MRIDGGKLKAAMEASGVTIPQLMKVTRLSQGRISQLRNNGSTVNQLAGEAICKRLKCKPVDIGGE